MADPTPYEIPRYGAPASSLHPWLLNALAEGQAWLGAQSPAADWERAQQVLSGPSGDPNVPAGQSSVGYNKVKRTIRELVAALANFRHEGAIKARWDKSLYTRAHIFTQLDENAYRTCKFNVAHRGALQYALGLGTAYIYETWNKHKHGPYLGDIDQKAISPADVFFVQLPADHDIQKAYAVIIREEMPLNLAKATYGATNAAFAASLVPDRNTPGFLARGLQKVQQFLSPALRVGGLAQKKAEGSFPTVDIFHMYTLDAGINDSGFPVQMGAHGTNWSYTVPSLGDPVNTTQINPQTGEYFTRPAEAEDCRLFPLRRLTIFARTGICYDGSSPWWHGQVPLARLRFNDWTWESLGSSTAAEIISMQDGIVALMRLIEDSAAARLDPPMLYDDTLVSSTFAQAFNPRRAGARAAAQINAGEIVKFPVDPGTYDVPPWIPEWIQAQEGRMDYQTGVTDMVAIAKAKQVPGADTLEKLLEMAGPIVQDMVRALEEPLVELGNWRIAYYLQFYTRPRMITTVGPNGTAEDIQYTPDMILPGAHDESSALRTERARQSISSFMYEVTESGINQIHRMTTKLFYLQLMKAGFPISWWTMAEVAQIPNFGPPPEGTHTEMEKYVAQQHMMAELQVDLAEQMALVGPAGGVPPGQGGAPAGKPPVGGPVSDQFKKGPGRPNSDQKPPRIESKDGGTRSTVTTS